ncbi:uncharacterized protein LOC103988279 isoform X2 [Musa acuminata AAA Group]|uniref:uncharacterized protein LOC103988279 isoform X2 n=1 Tax=Musa acuminata AAA Group TaxID=214697 RepID=UPI0031D1F264
MFNCVLLWFQGSTRGHQVPAFGYWDHRDELPITRCFELAVQAEWIRGHCRSEDGDLFKVAAPAETPACCEHHHRKVKKGGCIGREKEELQKKQGRATAPKAVDEDLYKIPPELLHHQKPKRARMFKNLWSGCMGLDSVA